MRLWEKRLLPYLPKQWLQGQHRECCALRGKGWGKKHSTVDYVFKHPYQELYRYHRAVIYALMCLHGVKVDGSWLDVTYRGKVLGREFSEFTLTPSIYGGRYPEHNNAYLQECLENLRGKGIVVDMKQTSDDK